MVDEKATRAQGSPTKSGFYRKASMALVLIFGLLAIGGTASAAAGDLDPTFGEDGRVTTDFDSGAGASALAGTSALVVQPDGKVVAAGYHRTSPGGYSYTSDFALARYNEDGTLDTSFGEDGKVITDLGGYDEASALVLQPDGRLIAAGKSNSNFALARYDEDGNLDPTFGEDGKATTDFGEEDYAEGLVIQSDGKIVAAGSTYGYTGNSGRSYVEHADFALARYEEDGDLDTSFDEDGKATTDMGGDPYYNGAGDYARALALQPDGKLVAAGEADHYWALARYNEDGSLDEGFGGDGKVVPYPNIVGPVNALTLQSDGKIVAAGEGLNGGFDLVLDRYDEDGSEDESFGGGFGAVTTDFGSYSDGAQAVAVQSDGKLVAASTYALARYSADGSLDASFGTGGKVTADTGNPYRITGLAIQPDGKLVAGGTAERSDGSYFTDFALARYDANTAPVANDDSYKFGGSKATKASTNRGVLANDEDADNDDLSAEVIEEPKNGKLTMNKDGSFVYKPDRGFSGKDSFTYKATDGTDESEPATATIKVRPNRR